MNKRTLGDHFIEQRSERRLSEVRNFQEFRTHRDYFEVNDGNRRYKEYKKINKMKDIIQYQFGRKGRSVSSSSQDNLGFNKKTL